MAPAVFTMTCLHFVVDEIKPLGFLHLDVEGWEAYALCGMERHSAVSRLHTSLSVRCWMRGIGREMNLALMDADGSGPPYDDFIAAMAEHPNFERNQRYR